MIIKKVYSTSIEGKLDRYKNVLLREMYEHNDSEIFFKYLTLIDDVSDTQVIMMSGLAKYKEQTELEICQYLASPQNYPSLFPNDLNVESFKLENGQLILLSDISFFKHDLIKSGLIIMNANPVGVNYLSYSSIPQANRYSLTQIGKGFLKFIEEYGKENY